MFGLALGPELQPVAAIAVMLGMLAAFMWERLPVEVVAIVGASVLVVLGILPTDEVLDVFSNNAPWTIAAMLILVGALVRTGGSTSSRATRRGTWRRTRGSPSGSYAF
jgi:di/tricarboxylate transporter